LVDKQALKTNKIQGQKQGVSDGRQGHHTRYGSPDEELVLRVRRGEHDVLTRLRRYCRKQMTEEFALNLLYEVLDAYMKGKITKRV
jgi:hypothetical protein